MRANNGRLWAQINNAEFTIESLTKADLESALNVLESSFFVNEPICNACEINLPENIQARQELRELCRITALDGVSLVAKYAPSGKIVAVSFNKIQCTPTAGEEQFFLKFCNEQVQSSQAHRLIDFMIEVDEQTDVCGLYNMSCFCELMFLATLPAYERRGLGRELARYTIEMTKELAQGIGIEDINEQLRDKLPMAVTAIWTSSYSQKLGKRLGFKVLNKMPYDCFLYNGKRFDERINVVHKFCEHVAYVFSH